MNGPLESFALAAAVAGVTVSLAMRSSLSRHLLAVANERSLHRVPTPRVGGIGVLLGVGVVIVLLDDPHIQLLGAAALALGLFSLRDDWRPLPAGIRLLAHFSAAGAAVLSVTDLNVADSAITGLAALMAVLGIAWMTNLFNFMDGSDGMAGGMATIGFAALGLAAIAAHDMPLACACLAVSGASLAFLFFNAPPARVFLGDAGSIPIGFLAGSLGWVGAIRGLWPVWFPLLVFSPFIVDASVTLLLRAIRAEPLMTAHRSHHYQALVLSGWSHRRLAISAWMLMMVVASSALAALQAAHGVVVAIICAWAALYAAMCIAIRRHARA